MRKIELTCGMSEFGTSGTPLPTVNCKSGWGLHQWVHLDVSVSYTPPTGRLIVKLNVAEGDRVREHQTLAVLEAMKMEHAIRAPADGRVKRVSCAVGERVTGGAPLIELEPLSAT